MADDGVVRILPVRKTLDFATILGIITAFSLVGAAVFLGGSPSSFFNVPAILIVLVGTFAVTTICFSFGDMRRTIRVIGKTLIHSTRDASEAAIQIMKIAQMARKHGVLSLQDITDQTRREPFLFNGVSMIVDGLPGDEVERILRREMSATAERHQKSANILRRAAEFSPAMGLIGTLIGLVQMLGNLEDPTTIGPSMAVALLTTFYGAILANMVFIPLASKLERNSALEEMVNNVYLLGSASIGRQQNPRRLEMMLNSMMPPSSRIKFFD